MRSLVFVALLLAACSESADSTNAVRGGGAGASGESLEEPSGGSGSVDQSGGADAGEADPSGSGGMGDEAEPAGAGGGVAGGSGGGFQAQAGTGGQATAPSSQVLPLGDGGFPLFSGELGTQRVSSEEDGSYHLVFGPAHGVDQLSTHIHDIDLTQQFARIAFDVRASRRTTMFVAVTPIVDSYPKDVENGLTWLATEVDVGEEFASYELAFTDMEPIGEGEPRPLTDSTGTGIHFLFLDPSDTEFWLRNIELRP